MSHRGIIAKFGHFIVERFQESRIYLRDDRCDEYSSMAMSVTGLGKLTPKQFAQKKLGLRRAGIATHIAKLEAQIAELRRENDRWDELEQELLKK